MGGPVHLSGERRPARCQVHRVRRRFRGRRPRHPERGPAVTGGAPAAPRPDDSPTYGGGWSVAARRRWPSWQWQAALAAQRLAQEQRDRAERTLAAATETATITFTCDMGAGAAQSGRACRSRSDAQDTRSRARLCSGNRRISGEVAPDLLRRKRWGLTELALTLSLQGDNKAASGRPPSGARDIMSAPPRATLPNDPALVARPRRQLLADRRYQVGGRSPALRRWIF